MDDRIHAFCQRQRELLQLELQSEGESGSALHRLEIEDLSVGLYGRTVVRLEMSESAAGALLPSHRFTTGDEVEIRGKTTERAGVICEVTETSISVALFAKQRRGTEEEQEPEKEGLSLIPRSSVEVHNKLVAVLGELQRHGVDHPVAGMVVRALFDASSTDPSLQPPPLDWKPFNTNLDASQREAISFALSSNRPVSLLHGPPGTGKTTTVVELVHQAVQNHGMKVLVTAPSNVAVDNLLARLDHAKIRAVRLGHPARVDPRLWPSTLEALVQAADGTEIVRDARRELQSFLRVLNGPPSRDKRAAYREVKLLRQEIRSREEKVVDELLGNAQVVLATCVGAGNRLLRDRIFDLVIVDEAAQALEAACWIPALLGRKLVLAGDHCQLPPTIKSSNPMVEKELSVTMFERVMELYGDSQGGDRVSRMLRVQYRMHHTISGWASQALYHGKLETADAVRDRTLRQLSGVHASPDDEMADTVLLLQDTAGCDMYESTNAAGSRFNTGEANLVDQHVSTLIEMGLKAEQIAVITPYNGQVEVLKLALLPKFPKLEVRSVDGFQGGEREAVVLSLVRSSERGGMDGIGFLRDDRRLNVAVTRAKRHCCLICDTETVSQSSFVKNLIEWIENHGEVRSAYELGTGDEILKDMAHAETELVRMAQEAAKNRKVVNPSPTQGVKAKSTQSKLQVITDSALADLIEKIELFAKRGVSGETMPLSSTLSSADRRKIHELAERLGLNHESEGVEDGRRLVLAIPSVSHEDEPDGIACPSSPDVISPPDAETMVLGDTQLHESAETPVGAPLSNDLSQVQNTTAFAVLEDDDSVDLEASEISNSILGDLARERAARDRARASTAAAVPSRRPKKSQGKKLGGKPHPKPIDDGDDDLDDMAFLDAQIEKVQNSHGRKVDGKGSYKTIVNGILLAKPLASTPKKNTKASAALQAKIKKARDDRKPKTKKK